MMEVPNQMKSVSRKIRILSMVALAGTAALGAAAVGGVTFETYRDTSGVHRTFSTIGPIQPQRQTNAFFLPTIVNGQTNGKTCEHCHFASDGWGLLVDHVNQLFDDSQGLHPLFTPDSADNPVTASNPANVQTEAQRRQVYSLMLAHGDALVRINFAPALQTSAEFNLVSVEDKSISSSLLTGSAYFTATGNQFWFHRRPIPTTNFQFLSEVSWDGRSTLQTSPSQADIVAGVRKVAHDTIIAREGGGTLSEATLNALADQMTNFMFSTTTAQIIDNEAGGVGAGSLITQGATNGPTNLFNTPFFTGINDPFSSGFSPVIFNLYNSGWVNAVADPVRSARAQVLRGQAIFNSRHFQIIGVNGLNDRFGQPIINGTCGTCHNTPNVGNHSSRLDVALGVANVIVSGSDKFAPPGLNDDAVRDFPVYTLKNKTTNEVMTVTDLGLASVTGKWSDIGKFKVPVPRFLESRSPYFHNGVATSLEELVSFYNHRFNIGLTAVEEDDLVTYLKTQ